MRGFAHSTAVAIAALGLAGLPPAEAQTKDAASVIAAARQALGGEKKLAAVKSFTAQGRTRQVRGENLVPIEFEIFVELPDKYLRKDEIPAQESGPTASGFAGDDLLVDPLPPAPMPDPARKARVTQLKQDFARLALGMFAGSFPSYPLTFTYVGQAEAPQGKADVVDAKGPDNFTLRYFINSETHLPIMVTWQQPAPPARGGGPGRGPGGAGPAAPPGSTAPGTRGAPPAAGSGAPAGAPPAGAPPAGAAPAGRPPAGTAPTGAPPAGAAPQGAPGAAPGAPRPEFRMYFAEYREVDGLQLPFRIRRATGTETTEETTFDRYRINAKIDPRRFDVRK
ncbi:MAG TPA: hypothetical protein VFK57_15220 [Vicinamibacterales bacterium]|nr:hypothetical protein [Vicinamibacterales bacterium]